MTDTITRLNAALEGRYRIDHEIGEGGMAVVYLAEDLRHHRKVALKVLRPELAAVVGAERFLAEIQTTANLNHPHILPLFDSGEADSFLFFVMPYVEGETLREKIDRERQLPVDEALGIATSVASALQHAHERGVIHRDIKPGNILLQDGQPLVADFGIALAVGAAGGHRLTETGLSVGTPYYMSPEQATGDQVVGPASDIYALACVLYEMLTGEPPYPGNTAQAVLGKIIQGVPVSATAARKSVPANVDAAIRKALEKLPADRFTGAHAFAKALSETSFRWGDAPGAGGAGAVGPAAARLRWLAVSGWAAAILAVVALAVVWSGRSQPVPRVERFSVPFLPGQEPTALGSAGYDLSPDGSMLVYRFSGPSTGGRQVLMVRRWDDLAATPVRETEGGSNPAISPDGLELAFSQGGQIRVLAFSGGPVRTLLEGGRPEWGPDGFVYATVDSGTVRIPSTGGAVELVSRLGQDDNGEVVYDVLPGGDEALLMVLRSTGDWELRGTEIGSGVETVITEGSEPRYLPSGHLVFKANDGTMMAARFDPDRMELLGTPIAIMDDASAWSLSDDGKLFYTTGGGDTGSEAQLLWVDRAGVSSPVDSSWTFQLGTDANQGWSVSPDGSMIAVREFTSEGYDIWIKQLDTGPRSRLTFWEGMDRWPVWAPNSRNVTFLSDRNGNQDVWSRPADGTRDAELLLDLDENLATIRWSPDGEWLLLRTTEGTSDTSQRNILAWRPGVDSIPTPLFAGSYREVNPDVSPDGHWIAYASDETGRYEIYVQPFPEVSGGRRAISVNGGQNPRWSHAGGEIFFVSPSREMMVAEVSTDPDLVVGTPTRLFQGDASWLGTGSLLYGLIYDLHPDDQRFLVATRQVGGAGGQGEGGPEGEASAAPSVVLVNNFDQVLREMVPK